MPERFTESEIQIAIGNILKRALDRKDNGGLQKTNNSEQQGNEEQDDGVQRTMNSMMMKKETMNKIIEKNYRINIK